MSRNRIESTRFILFLFLSLSFSLFVVSRFLQVSSSPLFSSSVEDSVGISSSSLRHLAPLNSFSVLDGESRHHLRSFLPPIHLLSFPNHFHSLSFNSIPSTFENRRNGFSQPFPNRISLEFDAFDRHFSLTLDLMPMMYESGSYMSMRGSSGEEIRRVEHVLASYWHRVSPSEWSTATLNEDGTFHAVIYVDGEVYQADPLTVHRTELQSDEYDEISMQAQRNMVIFRHSDLIDQEKNHICGAKTKPDEAKFFTSENQVDLEMNPSEIAQNWNASYEFNGVSTRKLLQLNQATLPLFSNCYPGSSSANKVSLGVAVDYGYYQIWGSDSAVQARIASLLATANIVYMQQLNIFLSLSDTIIQTAMGGPAWNNAPASIGGSCTTNINDVLNQFSQWKFSNYASRNTLWHQLTACFPPPGVVGLAWIGVLCNQYYATGVSSHNSYGWLTVAHEIGHGFGATHTFQNGQGTTGSIMDYCDGKLPCGTGSIEFHPVYTQPQMCAEIASVKSSTGTSPFCVATLGSVCGNGIVEPGEACDDNSGCCVNCQFKSGVQCSGNTECCVNCAFAPSTTSCESGQGYCGNGQCVNSICNAYSGITFCGLKSGNSCRQQCKSTSTGVCSDGYSTPNLNIADGTVCNSSPYSLCSNGNCVSQGGSSGGSPAPAVTYSWQAGTWGACSCSGQQTRTNACVGSDGSTGSSSKCSGSQPSTSQSCSAPASCVSYAWNSPSWSACSVDCGGGTQTSALVCAVVGTGQVVSNSLCNPSTAPPTSQSCNAQSCPTAWQYSAWGQCSASCGTGTQSRTATCYETQSGTSFVVAASSCSNEGPVTQSCNQNPCPTYSWVYGTWTSCSVACGGGSQTNQAHCVSSTGQTVDNSLCSGSSTITQSCNAQACPNYQWQYTSDWSACSLSCGGGVQSRGLQCVDTTTGTGVINSYCVLTAPPTSQSCNSQACASYAWAASQWGACSQTCGGGTQSRLVTCINQANGGSVANSNCAGSAPTSSQPCNAQACASSSSYMWWIGGWSTCSSLCNGVQVRYVGCVPTTSFTPVSNSLCSGAGAKPASSRSCNYGSACYDETSLPNPNNSSWIVSEWGPCTSVCGGGYRNRTLACEDQEGNSISISKCPQPAPVVALNDVCGDFTCPVFWYTSDFDSCTADCGGGMMTRTVECRLVTFPDGPAVDEELCTGTKPSLYASCGSNPCPSWVPGAWSNCSSPCGYGVSTRQLVCTSYDNRTLSDDDCANAPLLTTQEVCQNAPCPHWHREDWGQCNKPCGRGTQTRQLVCRMPHDSVWHGTAATNVSLCPPVGVGDTGDGAGSPGVPSGKPPSIESCNIETCPAYYWMVQETGTCSQPCGGGTATGTVVCVDAATGATADGSLCVETEPSQVYNCNPNLCPSYNWFPYTDWSNCSVFCGSGTQTRQIKCRNIHPTSNLPLDYDVVDDSFCTDQATNNGSPPPSSQACSPPEDICDGGVGGEVNGVCNDDLGECVCRLGYGGSDCSFSPSLISVETNAIYYTQGVPINEYLDISWVSTGDLPYLSILLLKNGDPDWPFGSYLAQQIINTNDYVWQVGSALPDLEMGDGYQIRVWFDEYLYADSQPFSIADPCAYKFCGDKGLCVNGTCQCVPGYSGITCAIGPCERAKCDNLHSSCNNDDYVSDNAIETTVADCPCLDGYTGSQCKTPPSCSSKICKNGADLTPSVVHANQTDNDPSDCGVCDCLNGWKGEECDTCTVQCHNGGNADGTCSQCICPPGFFGSTCDCRYYVINIPLALPASAFLGDPMAESRFQRTLANDLAIAAGVATGVVVEVVVNQTVVDYNSGDVIATVFFSLECILSSASEGGVTSNDLIDSVDLDSSPISNGATNRWAAHLYGSARDAIQTAAYHFDQQGKYAVAQSAVNSNSTSLLLPGQQGSLSLAFSMLSSAFANADSMVYNGVVSSRIDLNAQITASDPTNQDVVPSIPKATDPFSLNRGTVSSRGDLGTGSVAAVVACVLFGAILFSIAIAYWWWRRVKKQRVSQEMEMESRVLRELKSDKHQKAYEPQTPFTPATPATATNLLREGSETERGQYRPPTTTEVVATETGRASQSNSVDRRPLVHQKELKGTAYERTLR